MFKGKVLIGAAIKNDLTSLGMNLRDCPFKIEDIQDFYRDSKGQPISLAYLGEHFLGENIHGSTHSSIKDARLTALCDRKRIKLKEINENRFSCPVMDEIRCDPQSKLKKNQHIKFDRCTCGASKNKKKKSGKKPVSQSIYVIDDDFDLDEYI